MGANIYTITGTAGQSVAGATTGDNYNLIGGFQVPVSIAPTGAGVTISGRLTLPEDLGLTNALLTLTAMSGEKRTTRIGKFGAFRFTEVVAGATYILSVGSKRYAFAPHIVMANADLTELSFMPVY